MQKSQENKPQKRQVTNAEYLVFRRDQRTKQELKELILRLFDKVKNWK